MEKNVRSAVEELSKYGLSHRPHIKAHKSIELALLQQKLGCKGITCAKLREAEVMASGGLKDMLIAFPIIGPGKLKRLKQLLDKGVSVTTIVNSTEGAAGLSSLGEEMGKPVRVLIEMDGHIGRGGVRSGSEFEDFVCQIKNFKGIRICGVECYGGDIYDLKDEKLIRERARKERDEILVCSEVLRRNGLEDEIKSGGSSFSLLYPEELEGITEVRAGNYIFNDNALFSIGLRKETEIGLFVYATVVAKVSEDVYIIDAGSKVLTSDQVHLHEGFGTLPLYPKAEIIKLNEEHGFVRCSELHIGEVVKIIPNHACVIPNLFEEIPSVRNGKFDHYVKIDAHGRNEAFIELPR